MSFLLELVHFLSLLNTNNISFTKDSNGFASYINYTYYIFINIFYFNFKSFLAVRFAEIETLLLTPKI